MPGERPKKQQKNKTKKKKRKRKTNSRGVPVVAQWFINPTRNNEVAGSIPDLAQWVKNLVLP